MMLVVVSSLAIPHMAHAEKDLKDVQNERKEIKKDLTDAEKKVADLLIDIRDLNDEIAELNETLKANEQAIKEVEGEIKEVEKEIAALEEKIEERFEILKERAKSYQSNGGDVGYLEVLLGAKDFNEFISRVGAITKITDSDAQLIEEQEKDKAKVEEKLAELEELKNELVTIEENLQEEKTVAKEKKAEIEKKKNKLEKFVSKLEGKDEKLKDLETKLIAEMAAPISGGGAFSAETANSNAVLGWPTTGGYISSHVGERWGTMHKGIDIARTDRSTSPAIFAAADGTIESAGFNNGGYGNMVIINHGNGLKTLYAHMSSLTVSAGQSISRGEQIGVMGTTGSSTGIHLHFEVHVNGAIQNPVNYLK